VDHQDHVALIRAGVVGAGSRWLELGAGRGAFTLAIAELVGPGAAIVALDRDRRALDELAGSIRGRFPDVGVEIRVADFTRPTSLPPGPFDGVLMANSLHFVRDKLPVVVAAMDVLRPGGRFVLVEYGADRGNPWVPWPIGFATWKGLADRADLRNTRLIGEVPSRFLGTMYAAVSERE
jgi:SAM-dependent methyltransferase